MHLQLPLTEGHKCKSHKAKYKVQFPEALKPRTLIRFCSIYTLCVQFMANLGSLEAQLDSGVILTTQWRN